MQKEPRESYQFDVAPGEFPRDSGHVWLWAIPCEGSGRVPEEWSGDCLPDTCQLPAERRLSAEQVLSVPIPPRKLPRLRRCPWRFFSGESAKCRGLAETGLWCPCRRDAGIAGGTLSAGPRQSRDGAERLPLHEGGEREFVPWFTLPRTGFQRSRLRAAARHPQGALR